jgi:hypothetical protein
MNNLKSNFWAMFFGTYTPHLFKIGFCPSEFHQCERKKFNSYPQERVDFRQALPFSTAAKRANGKL